MKATNITKAGVILSLLLFFVINLNASNKYVLSDDNLIDPRAMQKIYEIGTECELKTGAKIYLYVKESYSIPKDIDIKDKFLRIKEEEQSIIKDLKAPFVLMTMSLEQIHVNLIQSDDLKNIIDKDDILNEYVIPLLASKDKNKLYSKTSAAMLNGYAQIADTIAESKNITLDSSMGSSGKTAGTIWKVFMYFVVIIGLLLYTYAVLKSKKKS